MRVYLLFVVCWATLLAGCEVPFQPNQQLRDEARFTMLVPDEWKARRNPLDSPYELIAPATDDDNDNYTENIHVGVINSTGLSLKQVFEQQFNVEALQQTIPGFEVIQVEDARIGLFSAKRVVYKNHLPSGRFQMLTYLVVAGNRAYLLTATAEADRFAQYLPIFERVCHSFRVEPDLR